MGRWNRNKKSIQKAKENIRRNRKQKKIIEIEKRPMLKPRI